MLVVGGGGYMALSDIADMDGAAIIAFSDWFSDRF